MRKIVVTLSLLGWLTAAAFAQSTQPSRQYDWSTPLAADASLQRARQASDQAAVIGAYHAANDDERALLSALDEQWGAAMRLHKTCLERFLRGRPSRSVDRPADKRIEADVQGDEAIVYAGGRALGLGVTWVRVDGEWKVAMSQVLSVHLRAYKTLQGALDEKRDWTDKLRRVTDEIKAGRYSSPEEVGKVLDDLAASEKAPSTRPNGK